MMAMTDASQFATGDGEQYEEEHVHRVYEAIAHHFSSTRHKPWPIVDGFLAELRPGSVGLDVGCGNGKYLKVNPDVFIVASDRSQSLVEIAAAHQPHSCIVADALNLPHPPGSFDFGVCIAVIHHLSTRVRRVEAIRSILSLMAPASLRADAGKLLLFVWALEQKTSRRGWDHGDQQDVIVPWISKTTEPKADKQERSIVYNRYYHLYSQGELENDIHAATGTTLDSGYEKDNWWAICCPGSEETLNAGPTNDR